MLKTSRSINVVELKAWMLGCGFGYGNEYPGVELNRLIITKRYNDSLTGPMSVMEEIRRVRDPRQNYRLLARARRSGWNCIGIKVLLAIINC
jgi:hypothetical protein